MRQVLLASLLVTPLLAQEPLSLRDAVRLALEKHPSVQGAVSSTRAAESRIGQARSGLLPRVGFAESWARSDNPVFVFSSLLTQHQFSEANFRIGPLNRPDFLNNFQSQATVDQTVYDWGATRANVRAAEMGRTVSREQERRTRMDLIARVVRAYHGAVLAQASLEAAREALKSAEADIARARTFRDAGMSTDADLLSIQVHAAHVREQEIRRGYDARIAMAALNEALALPLETSHRLTTELTPAVPAEPAAEGGQRPEVRQAELAARIAEERVTAAKSALLPQIGVRGAFEANRQEFVRKGGANWLVAASLRWNLFDGNATRARIAEAQAERESALARQRETSQHVKLQVFEAWANARAAQERLTVAAAAVAQAEESLRIAKNRYDAGLSTVTDLLRNEVALLDARTRRLAAIHDGRVAAAMVELAAGTLTEDSEVLR